MNVKETALDREIKAIRERHRSFESNKKRQRKRVTIASSSASLLAFGAATAYIFTGCSKNKKSDDLVPTESIVGTLDVNNNIPEDINKPEDKKVEKLSTTSLTNLGIELELPKKDTPKKEFGTVTGDIKPEKVVEDNKGTLWVTPEAESKKDNVGKVVIDDEKGKLEVKEDGKVVEKAPSYEIKDESGKVVETGTLDNSNSLPSGWAYDKDTDKNLPSDEVGKYTLEKDDEVWKKDGNNYESYQQALEDAENGKNITTKIETISIDPVVIEESEIIYYDTDKVIDNTTSDTNQSDQINNSDLITPPSNEISNLYLDPVSGLYFESEADYQQWVFQDYEGYGIVNGVMKSQTKEMDEALKEYIKIM